MHELDAEQAAKTFETAKTDAEAFAFKKWVTSEATPDGWILVYEGAKLDAEGNEAGTQMQLEVERKIGDKTCRCWGTIDKLENVDGSVQACKSVRPS